MGAYVLRRLILMVPTLLRHPARQLRPRAVHARRPDRADHLARLQRRDLGHRPHHRRRPETAAGGGSEYKRRPGPAARVHREPREAVRLRQAAAGTRFLLMLKNYLTFNFGESYFRSISVVDLVLEKMPVSISLGLWSTLLAYLISIPLGIAQGDPRRLPLRHRDQRRSSSSPTRSRPSSSRSCCSCSSPAAPTGASSRSAASPPTTGPTSPGRRKILDYFWHITLPVIASTIGAFATMTLLTKNSFLDEIKKQYVITARAKGLPERPRALRPRLPQRDADRDRGLPGDLHLASSSAAA